jgi:C4-dicarboxylate-specific signal transduction histidine kinase
MRETPNATIGTGILPRPVQASDALTMFGFAIALAQSVSQPLAAIAVDTEALCRLAEAELAEHRGRLCPGVQRLRSASGKANAAVLQALGILNRTNEWARIELDVLIRDVAMRIATSSLGGRLQFVLDLAPALPSISANRSQIERLLWEVIRNAAEASGGPRAGNIRIATSMTPDFLSVSIEDDGPGCADPEAAFALFHTTKPGHVGIGLSIARAFATANGGQLSAEPGVRGGLQVLLRLPRSDRTETATGAGAL